MTSRPMRDDETLSCLRKGHPLNGCRFTSKDEMMEVAEREGLLSFAHDYHTGDGSKYYHAFTGHGVVDYVNRVDKNRLWLHEVIMDGRLTKLVMDIECDATQNAKLNFHESMMYVVDMLVLFYKDVHGIDDVMREDFTILSACRPGKFSAHIVQTKGVAFACTATLAAFLSQFEYWLMIRETKQLADGGVVVDAQDNRVSIVVADDKPIVVPSPRASFSFRKGTDDGGEEQEGGGLKLVPFVTMFDWHPIRSRNGSLRTYYSTKPGHDGDEHYRLRKVVSVVRGSTVLENDLDVAQFLGTLSQAVFPTYVRSGEEKITRVLSSKCDLHHWDRYSGNIALKICEYTFFYLTLCGGGIVSGAGFATTEDLRKLWGSERVSFIPGLMSLLRVTHSCPGGGGGAGQDHACNIRLDRSSCDEIYQICGDILGSYTMQAKTRHVSLYGENAQKPELCGVKINRQGTALCLIVRNVPCEIVRDENSGTGHSSPSQNTWLKIIVPNGTYTQRCFKQRCSGKRSILRMVRPELMFRLREALARSERVRRITRSVSDDDDVEV